MLKRLPQGLIAIICLCGFVFSADTAAIWLDVPFVKQTKDGCGAASIAMVMQYWAQHGDLVPSPDSDAEQILAALYSPNAHGIYASKVEAYLQQHGFRTFVFQGRWDDLQQHLQKGRPLIVALKPGHGELHYVVVAGIDTRNNLVMVNDPAQRKLLKTARTRFQKEWAGAGSWTLLAVPMTSVQ
ncbi:MAG TPA: C39 family peptidase [Terriglobales bacterium]|nr:C39 family peptidase [Terriglobales bacterium]